MSPASEPRVRITCPSCGAGGEAPARLAGRPVRCSRCRASFQVPEVMAEPVPTIPEELAPTVPPPPPDEAGWSVGEVVLGLYEIRAVLGQGGMGRVYQARHRGWGVDLAIKTPLRAALEAAGGAEAFEQEAETWVNLGLHPHTVSCYYVRRLEGVPRVFAEYVDGGSLAQAIKARRLTTAEAILDVAIQFAWGLHYAHEQGLVHRDVKPANVMLTSDGVAKVTDFGLASARVPVAAVPAAGGGEHTTIAPGGAGGTPAYMSPEQSAGEPLTRRTDAWGWALSVLEMFAGRRTWPLGPAAAHVLEEHLAAPASLEVPLREPVAALLRRCFARDPGERPRTMADAAEALVEAYAAEVGRPYPRARPLGGRHTAGSLNNRAVSLLDLGRGGAEALWQRALEADPQHLEASYNHALFAWTGGRLADEDLLARVREARRANEGVPRAAELEAQARRAVGERVTAEGGAPGAPGPGEAVEVGRALRGFTGPVAAFAVAPDGGRIVATQGEGAVRVWLASGEAQRPLAPAGLRVKALAVTADGAAVVLAGEGSPEVWDLASGRPLHALAPHPGWATCLAATRGGRVAGGCTDRALRVWDIASGKLLHVLEGHAEAVTGVAASADGARLVSGGREGTVRVWDLASGRLVATLAAHRGAVQAVAFGPGGVLLSGGEDRLVHAWDLAGGTPMATLAGPAAGISGIVALSAPPRVLVTALDRTARVWDLSARTVEGVARLEAPIAAAAGTAAGRTAWAAVGSAVVELRAGRPGRPPLALSRPTSVMEVASRESEFQRRLEDARRSFAGGDLGEALTLLRAARTIPGHERSQAALTLWDDVTAALPRRDLEAVWQAVRLEAHRDPVVALAVDPAGRRALSGDLMGCVKWWDLGSRSEIASATDHEATVSALACAGEARAASASWDRTVRLWDGPGRLVATLDGHGDYVNGVALSPDGRTVLSASSDQTLRLWSFAAGPALAVLEGHEGPVSACVLGPEARFALSAGWDGTLRLWDVQARSAAGVLRGHEGSVGTVALAPGGREAASGGLDRVVRVWDLAGRRLVRSLAGHDSEVTTVAYFPDGRHLVSASRDKTVRIWDAARGACLRTLTHDAAVLAAAALPSGNALLCGGAELALTVWRLDWKTEGAATLAPRAAATLRSPAAPSPSVPVAASTTVRAKEARAWEDIQRAAPRVAAREAAVEAARRARRVLPGARAVGLAAVLTAAVVGGVLVLRPHRSVLGLSHHRSEWARHEVDLVDVRSAGGACDGSYEEYLDRAKQRVVTEDVIGCLARLAPPGLVEVYLRDVPLEDEEPTIGERKRRNAVSLLVALGESAVPSVCQALRGGREPVRWVAARALGMETSDAATACVVDALSDADPAVRGAAVVSLRILVGRGAVPVPRAWELAGVLRADSDARVREAAVSVVALFDYEHAERALAEMEKDADPSVAFAAGSTRVSMKNYHDLNSDLPY